jgi:hypothetical protein
MCLYIQARPIKPISLQTSDKPNTNEGIFYLRLALLEPEEDVLTEETTDSGDVQEVRPLRELNIHLNLFFKPNIYFTSNSAIN